MRALKKYEENLEEMSQGRVFDTYNRVREQRIAALHERLADYDLDEDYLEAIDEIADGDWTMEICLAHDFDKD